MPLTPALEYILPPLQCLHFSSILSALTNHGSLRKDQAPQRDVVREGTNGMEEQRWRESKIYRAD